MYRSHDRFHVHYDAPFGIASYYIYAYLQVFTAFIYIQYTPLSYCIIMIYCFIYHTYSIIYIQYTQISVFHTVSQMSNLPAPTVSFSAGWGQICGRFGATRIQALATDAECLYKMGIQFRRKSG